MSGDLSKFKEVYHLYRGDVLGKVGWSRKRGFGVFGGVFGLGERWDARISWG